MTKEYVPYEGPIVTRKEAQEQGLKRFFTGKLCRNGHISQKSTHNKGCVECERIAARSRYKPRKTTKFISAEIRAEAVKEGKKTYFTGFPCKHGHVAARSTNTGNCKECGRLLQKELNKRPARIAERKKAAHASYLRNRDKVLERSRLKHQAGYGKTYYEKNKEAVIAVACEWAKRNPEKKKTYGHKRRALKNNSCGSFTPEDIAAIRSKQKDRCAYCRCNLKGFGEIDHIIPLSAGGSNNADNLQLTCKSCNCSKGAKDPIEFAQSRGLLI